MSKEKIRALKEERAKIEPEFRAIAADIDRQVQEKLNAAGLGTIIQEARALIEKERQRSLGHSCPSIGWISRTDAAEHSPLRWEARSTIRTHVQIAAWRADLQRQRTGRGTDQGLEVAIGNKEIEQHGIDAVLLAGEPLADRHAADAEGRVHVRRRKAGESAESLCCIRLNAAVADLRDRRAGGGRHDRIQGDSPLTRLK